MTKGKCFSMVDQGQRKKGDAYYTPTWATKLFLERESFEGCHSIWEPCAGEGAITKELLNAFSDRDIMSTDIYNEGWRYFNGQATVRQAPADFLTSPHTCDAICSNPPYSLFQHIILKAKRVTSRKIAMLLPLSYLQGQTRYDELWMDKKFPLARIYVFNRFFDLSLPLREDSKLWLGMQTYAWYVWDKFYEREPTIRWIDCRKYVVSPKGQKHE